MRQAGRCLPAYRALRAKNSFGDLISRADLITQVVLMPLEVLEVDAAILFADIMTPVAALGIEFDIVEAVGPVVSQPIDSLQSVDKLNVVPAAEAVPQLFDAIKMVRAATAKPLIGFAGGPFTLASYLVEGRADRAFTKTMRMMRDDPETWHALLAKLTDVLIDYLGEQVRAGAQALQIFDSWVGALSAAQYQEFALPYSRLIFEKTAGLGVPRIHFGTNTADLLELMASPEPEVIGVDWRIPLDEAWLRIGHEVAIQGNLDPAVLLSSPDAAATEAREILRRAGGRPGHIFNLGHGVAPDTPVDNIKALVDTVHSYR